MGLEPADRGIHAAGKHGRGQADTRRLPHPRPPQATPSAQGTLNTSGAGPGCLSRKSIFSIPDPGFASKNLSILTQKIVLSSQKYDPGC